MFLGAGTGRTIAAGCTYLSILVRSRVCRMDRVVKCYFVTSNQNLVAGEFVGAHGLVTNDFILIYQNVEDGKYVREPTNPLLCFPFICFPNSYTHHSPLTTHYSILHRSLKQERRARMFPQGCPTKLPPLNLHLHSSCYFPTSLL